MKQIQKMQVAEEIMSQLKNSKVHGFPFFAYSGAKDFVGAPNFLQFSVPNKKRIAKIRIVLDAVQDLYNLEFYKKKGLDMIKMVHIDGIYADQMVDIIVRELGIY